MKLIMENWRSFLTERDPTPEEWEAIEKGQADASKPKMSKEEVVYWGSAFAELMENPELSSNRPWIEENIGDHLGSGAFRSVFEIRNHPDKVFKVGAWSKSKMMNYMEKTSFSQNAKWFPKVYLTNEVGEGQTNWLVLEKIQVVDDRDEYQELLEKNFPALREAHNLIYEKLGSHIWGSNKGRFKSLIRPEQLFNIMIKDRPADKRIDAIYTTFETLLKRFDSFAWGINGKETVEEAIEILDESNIVILQELLDDVGFIQRWDIRTKNIGRRGDQLVLIDIYINDKKSPNKPPRSHPMYENKKHIKVLIK